ncbi:MAG: amino acid permease [Gemmatimonadetes bacterium]|nr:amino acid permease [Gemmatimonadota bacterium]
MDERLPRHLGLWSAAAVLVGTTIGSGIFRVPREVAAALGDPQAMLLIWVVGGIVTLTGALTIAELAAAYPRSGGIFAYILEAFGPLPAFLYGWAELTVIRAAAIGGISLVFATYLGEFFPLTDQQERLVASGVILVIALLNYLGVGLASLLMNVTTILKYGAMLGLGLFAFAVGGGTTANFVTPSPAATVTLSTMLTALVPIMWTYDGWSNLSFIGGEVKEPGRNLPKALILGTVAIVAIYLFVNAAYLYMIPAAEMATIQRVASETASRIALFGGAGAAIISGVVMISCFGSVNGSVMTGPRIFFAMSEQKLIFPVIARVSPRFQTPSVAIWLTAALGVAYVMQNSFAELADRFVLGSWPFYAMAVAGVFVLRKRSPDVERPYRTLGYPLTPAIFLLASLGMVANALLSNPAQNGVTFGIILVGVPVYFVWRRFGGKRDQ